MQRAEFENKVQEKMQELRFRPSDEVWKHIEAGIEKRKRRTPAMIWMLVGALVLGGISYYFLNNSTRKSSIAQKPVQQGQAIAEKQNQNEKENQLTNEPSHEIQLSATEQTQVKGQRVLKSNETNKSLSDAGVENKRQNVSRSDELPQLQNENAYAPQPAIDDNAFSVNGGMRSSFLFPVVDQVPLSNAYNSKEVDAQSGIMNLSALMQKTVENPSLKRKQWRFGITASAGVSSVGEQLFLGPTAAFLSYIPQSGSGNTVSGKPSDLKQGAAFSIGMYARKMIAAKWQLGAGISYQYFSNTIKVGEKVDSTVFLNQNNYSMDRVNQYYKSNGNSPYHNQYHFISLPVSIQWRFAKRFSWENQLVYSRLFNTNALHYDGGNRAYFENKDLFNKNQFAASTAVLFGFNKNRIQVGPQLQYAFTNLLSDNNGTQKHLRSVSIKSTIDLWKN